MFSDSKFFLRGVGNKTQHVHCTTVPGNSALVQLRAKLEFTRKTIPLLSMLNQYYSKKDSEVICGFILMKFVSLIWEMSVILCHDLK